MTQPPTVVVFAKLPRAGRVKTRMCPPLTAEVAAEFYQHMLDDVLHATARAARALGLEVWVAVHPAEGVGEIAARSPAGIRVMAQRGADLSERMQHASLQAAASGAARVLLRGSDSPTLCREHLGEALEKLDSHDLVVSPDRDGGYSLIGLRQPVPGLFDHEMSTDFVLDGSLGRAAALGLRCARLRPGFDIDSVADLPDLARVRATQEALLCPRTLRFALEHDFWGCA